ncbi:MAG: NADH-quinone oxidoreductase subunit C [Chloroflexi bacterium]|nr:NADH-quinone oxidoreductase subunit C [Chloroflexota bacterium]
MVARLTVLLAEPLLGDETAADGLTLLVARERLVEVLTALRDDPELAFGHLSDVTAVDYLNFGRSPRFDVVYHLLSRPLRRRLRLRVPLDEDDPIVPTVTGIYPTADWLEREANDLFGIGFHGHPDQRRILLPDDFEGHPLRKDFPIGAEEIAFSQNQERLYQGYPNPTEGHPPFQQPEER